MLLGSGYEQKSNPDVPIGNSADLDTPSEKNTDSDLHHFDLG